MRLVRRRGTAAVRATRLLLDRRGGCWRTPHAFKNNIEILLRRRYSSHLCDLLVARPTNGFPAARQHQLQDPRWRRSAVEHTLPLIGRRLDTDRFVGWERARRGEDILRQARALPNGSCRWCRRRGGGDVCCCAKRSRITCSFLLLVMYSYSWIRIPRWSPLWSLASHGSWCRSGEGGPGGLVLVS